MEVLIDYFGEVSSEAADLYEIVDARTQYPLQAAELLQQLASFHRPQARDGFEYRLAVTLSPFAPVSCNCKAVRLVAYTLNQMKSTGVRRQYSGGVLAQQE